MLVNFESKCNTKEQTIVLVEAKVVDALNAKDSVIQNLKGQLEESQIKSLHLEKILDKQRKVIFLFF